MEKWQKDLCAKVRVSTSPLRPYDPPPPLCGAANPYAFYRETMGSHAASESDEGIHSDI
jgi:hypothetical protein